MTFQTEMEKFSNEPVVLCTVKLDDGDQYIAKVDIAESSVFYDGYVKSFGSISRTVAGTNSNFKTSDVTITCINTDQHFSQNYNYKTLLNRTVSISVGTADLAIGAFKQIYKGVITNFQYGTDFKITVRDATERYIDTKDYAPIIDEAVYTAADKSVVGKRMPIIYGRCVRTDAGIMDAPCKALFSDTNNNYYIIAGHAVKSIERVYQTDSDGDTAEIVIVPPRFSYPAYPAIAETIDNDDAVDKGDGTVGIPITAHSFPLSTHVVFVGTTNYDGEYIIQSVSTDEIVIVATYIAETFGGAEEVTHYIAYVDLDTDRSDYDISADVEGVETVGDGSGTLITNPITQMEHFLDSWLSLPASLKDSTGITASETIAAARSYSNGGQILNGKGAKKVLQEMALCSNSLIFHNSDGEISVEIFDIVDFITGGVDPTGYTDQNEIFEKTFKLKPQLNNLANRVTVNYMWDEHLNEYKKQVIYDATPAQTAANKIYDKVLNFPFVNADAMAADVGQRYLKAYKYPPMQATFKTSLIGLNDDLANLIELSHFAGLDVDGYAKKLFKIEQIKPDLNKMSVTINAVEFGGALASAFILGDNTLIGGSWTDGDADQDYGYLCSNITDQFSNGDPGKRLY